jgi:hypothetical protein
MIELQMTALSLHYSRNEIAARPEMLTDKIALSSGV